MAGLAHIFLHVGLCNAVARLPSDATIAMRVKMSYNVGGTELDKVFRFERGDSPQAVVEFDMPRSVYRMQLEVPKYDCERLDYVDILADRDRTITENLDDGPAPQTGPVLLMSGTAPLSFIYTKPTFALFDKSVVCNQPIDAALPSAIDVEYDQGSYYAGMHADPSLSEHAPIVLALRLRTPTGTAHYVRIPIQFPAAWDGWPSTIQFNVTEDMIDELATEKVDTLLCPKVWESSVH
jgi:hypothetical protein